MRSLVAAAACLVSIAAPALAQVSFEAQNPGCSYSFPSPLGAAGDPEGISGNGLAARTVDSAGGFGMPVHLSQYARIVAKGPVTVPAGGPFPRPNAGANEIAIPIPPGTGSLRIAWEFLNREGVQNTYRDGMSIDVVSVGGTLITPIAFADTLAPLGPGLDNLSACGTGAPEILPAGPQFVTTALPTNLLPGAYLSVCCWNGGDNSVASHAIVDAIYFDAGGQTNTVNANFTVNGAGSLSRGVHDLNVGTSSPIDLMLFSSSATTANQPMILAASCAASPRTLITPYGQSVDLAIGGMEVYSAVLPGLLNSFFRMSGAGLWSLSFVSNTNGVATLALQTAILDPGIPLEPYRLSAAFRIRVDGAPPCAPTNLMLGDDAFVAVPLNGWYFPFYGSYYGSVFVSSNGRITLGSGSTALLENVPDFLNGPPQICAFWDDLDPSSGGSVNACSDPATGNLTVTWLGVPQYMVGGLNTASVALTACGGIRVIYGACALDDGLVGISPGGGAAGSTLDISAFAGYGFTAPPGHAIYELFPTGFDLDWMSLWYFPESIPQNSYRIE